MLVQSVGDDTPASRAGLAENDVIMSWNGTELEGTVQLTRFLRETPAGRTVSLGVIRDRNERTIRVELGERNMFSGVQVFPEHMARDIGERVRSSVRAIPQMRGFQFLTRGGRMGAAVQSLDGQLAEYFGLDDRSGVLVTSVGEDTPAEKAGLKAGDVILSVDGEDVEGPGDLISAILEADEGPVSVRILRDKKQRTLTVELPESDIRWESDDGEAHGFYFDSEDGDEPIIQFFGGENGFEDLKVNVRPIPETLEFYRDRGSVQVAPGGQIRVRRIAPQAPAPLAAPTRTAEPAVAL